jgi:hypothetical protein
MNNLEQAQTILAIRVLPSKVLREHIGGAAKSAQLLLRKAEQKGERVDILHVFPCVSSLCFLLRGGGGGGGGG